MGFVEFVRASPWGGWVHSGSFERALGSLGSFGGALVSLGSFGLGLGVFGFVEFFRARPSGHRVHFGSLCSFGRAMGVVAIIWLHPAHRCVHLGSF